ncbi:unnamed protein product [Thlaspi arvense]|uniref:Secreted protein n=1 Tax=Thlaspi arvense TaxID=13288 RepID=A0AAU9S2R8_THLAR|nr:unnamed protein product [Thlaspi arvense]
MLVLISVLGQSVSKSGCMGRKCYNGGGKCSNLTLFICLLTVLYLRERQRRRAVAAAGEVALLQPDHVAPLRN